MFGAARRPDVDREVRTLAAELDGICFGTRGVDQSNDSAIDFEIGYVFTAVDDLQARQDELLNSAEVGVLPAKALCRVLLRGSKRRGCVLVEWDGGVGWVNLGTALGTTNPGAADEAIRRLAGMPATLSQRWPFDEYLQTLAAPLASATDAGTADEESQSLRGKLQKLTGTIRATTHALKEKSLEEAAVEGVLACKRTAVDLGEGIRATSHAHAAVEGVRACKRTAVGLSEGLRATSHARAAFEGVRACKRTAAGLGGGLTKWFGS